MAKLSLQKGNSANIKIYLKDESGNNILNSKIVFLDACCSQMIILNNFIRTLKKWFLIVDIDYSEEKGVVIENSLGEQAIAGIEKHLSDFLIFYAPTVNSYKRLR